jgi:hypothetical protein
MIPVVPLGTADEPVLLHINGINLSAPSVPSVSPQGACMTIQLQNEPEMELVAHTISPGGSSVGSPNQPSA